MGIERRIMPRIDTSLEIAFRSSGVFMCSQMLNLSTGGIFIKTDMPLPVDAEIEIRLQLPGDAATLHLRGRVVWTKSESRAFPAGMGIQFIDLPTEYRKKIQAFVEESLSKKKSAVAL